MSSITFPHADHTTSAASSSVHESQFYPPPFDPSSSFQMNPLSSHPPRTPRTSIISSGSHIYGSSMYMSKEETDDQVSVADDNVDVDDVEEEKDKSKVESSARPEAVWREMFLTSNGRDKAFKLIQYSIRVYLIVHSSVRANRLLSRRTGPPWEGEAIKRLESTASGLSSTRKLLLLFNWLTPLATITAQQSVPYSSELSTQVSKKMIRPFLHAMLYAPPPVLLDLVQAVADDVATWSRLGLVGKKLGGRAERFSDWCWLFATLVGLVENGVERQMIGSLQREVESRMYAESMTGATAKSKPKISKIDEREIARLQRQDYWLQISRAKLLMDLIFVSYDVFRLKRAKAPVQAATGLLSAILASAKLYERHKTTLAKAVTY